MIRTNWGVSFGCSVGLLETTDGFLPSFSKLKPANKFINSGTCIREKKKPCSKPLPVCDELGTCGNGVVNLPMMYGVVVGLEFVLRDGSNSYEEHIKVLDDIWLKQRCKSMQIEFNDVNFFYITVSKKENFMSQNINRVLSLVYKTWIGENGLN